MVLCSGTSHWDEGDEAVSVSASQARKNLHHSCALFQRGAPYRRGIAERYQVRARAAGASGSAGASLRRLVIRESLLRQFEFVLGFVRGWLCRGGRSGGVVAMVGGVRRRARVVVGRVGVR